MFRALKSVQKFSLSIIIPASSSENSPNLFIANVKLERVINKKVVGIVIYRPDHQNLNWHSHIVKAFAKPLKQVLVYFDEFASLYSTGGVWGCHPPPPPPPPKFLNTEKIRAN